jgi:hypothetical protein
MLFNYMKQKIYGYKHAKKIVRSLNLSSATNWYKFCKSSGQPDRIPYSPQFVYKNKGWISWGDFLDNGNISTHKHTFCSFRDAKKFVQILKLKNKTQWIQYCKSNKLPSDIPSNPNRTYKNKGWISWGDFLDNGNIATREKIFCVFKHAKKFGCSLCLTSGEQWIQYCKSNKLPSDIPSYPNRTYKNKGWISWGDFLGIESISISKK